MLEQEKILRRKAREHKDCVREVILNIDELEGKTGKQVNPQVLKEIILNCPIELKIPLEDYSR